MADVPTYRLAMIVADLEITLQDAWLIKNGKTLGLYFDTADVRRAVLGANEFVSTATDSQPHVSVEEFDNRAVLVDCLLAAELLGSFAMLAPHQAEFLRHLQNDQAFREHGRRITEQQFLERVGIHSTRGTAQITHMSEEQIRAFVNSQAGQTTERFFKAVQCIRYTWWERLSILRAKKVFQAVTEKFDYSRLLDNKLLNAVLSAFERERGGGGRYGHEVSHNNFADAIALLMLLELVKRYRAGVSTRVPRFFDSTGLFVAVANSAGILPELTITDGGYTTSVIVRSDYFIHKATFQSNPDQEQALYEDLKCVLPGTEDIQTETSRLDSTIARSGMPQLATRVKNLMDLSFLENVWLRTVAVEELKDLALRLKLTSEDIFSERFRETVDTTIEGTKRELSAAANEYRRLSSIWLDLKKDIIELRRNKQTLIGTSGEFSAVRDFGLFRFTIPAETQRSIEETFSTLLADELDDKDVTNQAVWQQLVIACFAVDQAQGDDLKKNTGILVKAEFVGAVLWALKAYPRIIKILSKFVGAPVAFFVSVLPIAARFHLGKELAEGERLLDKLDIQYRRLKAQQRRSDMRLITNASETGYLWFHLWQARRLRTAWWQCTQQQRPEKEARTEMFIDRAIGCAKDAWENAMAIDDPHDPPEEIRERLIYVTNQWLYYLVEQGNSTRVADMEIAADHMKGFGVGARALWLPTYYDTLARYYSYRAFLSPDEETWKVLMDTAETYLTDAKPAAKDDPAVREFGIYFVLTKNKGFVGSKAPQSGVKDGVARNTVP